MYNNVKRKFKDVQPVLYIATVLSICKCYKCALIINDKPIDRCYKVLYHKPCNTLWTPMEKFEFEAMCDTQLYRLYQTASCMGRKIVKQDVTKHNAYGWEGASGACGTCTLSLLDLHINL